MRHTFVRQALIDGAPIEVVSELAGHANIATISIYSSQELARKIEAIRGGAQGGDSVMGAGCRHGLAVVG